MSIGQVSDPVKSQYGYHVIQVLEKRPPAESVFVQRADLVRNSEADVKGARSLRHPQRRVQDARAGAERSRRRRRSTSRGSRVAIAEGHGGDFQAFTEQLQKVADIQKAIDAGTDFAEIAKQYSEDSRRRVTKAATSAGSRRAW